MSEKDKVAERIAKLDYLWRFSGLAEEDTLDQEWREEPSQCIKQSCREFALEVLAIKNLKVIDPDAELPEMHLIPDDAPAKYKEGFADSYIITRQDMQRANWRKVVSDDQE